MASGVSRPRSTSASDVGGSTFAREALEYALKWRHWGGGDDEDIFVHFGISSHEYYVRISALLNTRAVWNLSFEERSQLSAVCDRRR